MDVFALREQLIGDYASYIQSFITIQDQRIADYVAARACARGFSGLTH